MTTSIRHNPVPAALPDFRNLGVWLRVLVGTNLLALLWVLARNQHLPALLDEFTAVALWVEPPLFLILPALHTLQPWLAGRALRQARLLVLALCLSVSLLTHTLLVQALMLNAPDLLHAGLWGVLAGLGMLLYFDYRAARYSPALAEARLLALTARIRPHFLFNSLNAVLGVIRQDPRRAEAALEELADLFRVLMRENRELVLLSEEIAIARQYLELERLRLGERLRVDWQVEACPPDTLMPPLMLQPLLENAVYHGIEPATTEAVITVSISQSGKQIHLVVRNPLPPGPVHHGNKMAMANIRERLMLFYDLEASLDTEETEGHYIVRISLPLRRKPESLLS